MRRINLFDIFGTLSLIVGTLFFIFFVLILPRSWTGSNYEALMGLPESAPTSDLVLAPPVELTVLPTLTPTWTPIPTATAIPVEMAMLIVMNESGSEVCQITVYGRNSDIYAPLHDQAPISDGETRSFDLPAASYALHAARCDGTLIERLHMEVRGETTWRIVSE